MSTSFEDTFCTTKHLFPCFYVKGIPEIHYSYLRFPRGNPKMTSLLHYCSAKPWQCDKVAMLVLLAVQRLMTYSIWNHVACVTESKPSICRDILVIRDNSSSVINISVCHSWHNYKYWQDKGLQNCTTKIWTKRKLLICQTWWLKSANEIVNTFLRYYVHLSSRRSLVYSYCFRFLVRNDPIWWADKQMQGKMIGSQENKSVVVT